MHQKQVNPRRAAYCKPTGAPIATGCITVYNRASNKF